MLLIGATPPSPRGCAAAAGLRPSGGCAVRHLHVAIIVGQCAAVLSEYCYTTLYTLAKRHELQAKVFVRVVGVRAARR